MSDATEGAPAPAATTAPATAAPQIPPADANAEPFWLKGRLERAEEQARKALLTELGITDPGAAKAALEAAKKAEEANKTAEQRAAELAQKLGTVQTEAERQAAVIQEYAARMFGVLTADQQGAVKAIAGDDPAAQLRAINALGPTWAKQAEAAAPAPAPKPATTAPAPDAPAGAATGSPPDHRAVYSDMRSRNPFAAAAYGLENPSAYNAPSS